MTAVVFLPMDVDAVEAGRRALHAVGDPETAAQLSWLAAWMRTERYAEIEQECHDLVAGRIEAYGAGGQRGTAKVQHLRSIGGSQ